MTVHKPARCPHCRRRRVLTHATGLCTDCTLLASWIGGVVLLSVLHRLGMMRARPESPRTEEYVLDLLLNGPESALSAPLGPGIGFAAHAAMQRPPGERSEP